LVFASLAEYPARYQADGAAIFRATNNR